MQDHEYPLTTSSMCEICVTHYHPKSPHKAIMRVYYGKKYSKSYNICFRDLCSCCYIVWCLKDKEYPSPLTFRFANVSQKPSPLDFVSVTFIHKAQKDNQ